MIRDLVCRGLVAKLFGQEDMRSMRLWFLQEKMSHSRPTDVSPELFAWVRDLVRVRLSAGGVAMEFSPEHGTLPGFNWSLASSAEWIRRHSTLYSNYRAMYLVEEWQEAVRACAMRASLLADSQGIRRTSDASRSARALPFELRQGNAPPTA